MFLLPEFFNHRETVHRQSAGFSSQVCSQRFYRKVVLQRHMKMYQPAVLLGDSAACPPDTTFLNLPPPPSPPPKRHGESPVCFVCAKTFATHKTLKRHRQTLHRQSGGVQCRVCDQRFYRRDHLKNHHIIIIIIILLLIKNTYYSRAGPRIAMLV